jgi:ubiquinone/menaquinone biosynthesis C-methylase UbiE
MSNLGFRLMAFTFRLRDILLPRQNILREVGLKPGFTILDYGCGPGSYSIAAAQLEGESGKVYALDVHPLAVQQVRKAAAKRQLTNIETILSDCASGLADESIDIALLYDTLHDLSEPDKVLAELHRVLKSNGILSCNDHHMREGEIVFEITDGGLFKLSRKGKRAYNFSKVW